VVFPKPARTVGDLLVPAGVAVTLLGVLGDLLIHTLNPEGHAHEVLIVLGRGNNPWHLVLFAGIFLTAVGAIRWMSRLESDWAALGAAGMVLLLTATVAVGGWTGWRGRTEHGTTGDALASASGAPDHAHAVAPAPSAIAAVAGEGAEGASEFGGHSHGKPEPLTAAEALVLKEQLAEARAASRKYRDVAMAKADGYIQVTQFIPGLGLHMVNLRISQTTFDPRRPQVLLYEPATSGGSLRLVGVAYTLQTGGDAPPEGFVGGSDVWHFHRNLCFLPNGSVTIAPTAGDCRAKSGFFQARTAWLLHAWVWKTNPDGVFTEVNPQVF
jgi:hypothetical protein